eukprot:g5126.t1
MNDDEEEQQQQRAQRAQLVVSRLQGLLDYVVEVSSLAKSKSRPTLHLRSTASSSSTKKEEGQLIIFEEDLSKLRDCTPSSDGLQVLSLSSKSREWLRIRRPGNTGTAQKAKKEDILARSIYRSLFSFRQEGLRDGCGNHQLTVGIGIVRWLVRDDSGSEVKVQHPLVTMPADLVLKEDGSFCVKLSSAVKPELWNFPGISQAAPALKDLNQCAKAYHLVDTFTTPLPITREEWEPLLKRASHCLAADGIYIDGPDQMQGRKKFSTAPVVTNSFVLFTEDANSAGVARDAILLKQAIAEVSLEHFSAALGRLAGVFDLPVLPHRSSSSIHLGSVFARTMRSISSIGSFLLSPILGAATPKAACDRLYFGLPSNKEQASVVDTLEQKGCAVLVGPPGTGKSQTIANVICHYLALGRRVLVTSKGTPATEVLRKKLPEGIQQLCVSLGSGDSLSYRRLEGAVEAIANEVAAAPLSHLEGKLKALQNRFNVIEDELNAKMTAKAEKSI